MAAAPVVAYVTPALAGVPFWPRRCTGSWNTGLLSKIGLAMASSWTDRALLYKSVTVANALGQGIVPGDASHPPNGVQPSSQGPMHRVVAAP